MGRAGPVGRAGGAVGEEAALVRLCWTGGERSTREGRRWQTINRSVLRRLRAGSDEDLGETFSLGAFARRDRTRPI